MVNDPIVPAADVGALQRRLATILAADVAGYSRMMGENEDATVEALRRYRAIFDALLAQHHGRVFNTAGDMILAEFPSAVEAVRCATEIQAAIQTKNEQTEPERRMSFRMGINLGDVIVQGGDLLGDGINVAARLQTVAEPGGICISGSVYDQILNKLSLQFAPLGERQFKNIARPVRTFSITHGEVGALPSPGPTREGRARWGVALAVAVVAAFSVVTVGFLWNWNERARNEGARTTQGAGDGNGTEVRPRAVAEPRLAAVEPANPETGKTAAEPANAPPASATKVPAPAKVDASKLPRSGNSGTGGDVQVKSGAASRPSTPATVPQAKREVAAMGSGTFDGEYRGQVCNFPQDPARRVCWKVPIQVRAGEGDATWSLRASGKPMHVHAVLAPDGAVRVTMDGWKIGSETPLSGAMIGNAADGRLDVEGRWSNGARVDGHWERAR